MNKKAFLLSDSLITITILLAMTSLIFTLYTIINNQEQGYKNYIDRTNTKLDNIFSINNICEACILNE